MSTRRYKPRKRLTKLNDLTAKMLLFCEAYLANKEMNASKAALSAGYKGPAAGWKLLATPAVAEYIGKKLNDWIRGHEMDRERVIKTLADTLYLDPALVYNEDGSVKPMREIPLEVRQCISKFEHKRRTVRDRDGNDLGTEDWHKVEFMSKDAALALAAKHFGLIGDAAVVAHVSVDSDLITNLLRANEERRGAVIDAKMIEDKSR